MDMHATIIGYFCPTPKYVVHYIFGGWAKIANIQVVNIKAHEHGSYIGRPSPLGNPFTIGKYTREEVIAMYRDWLRNAWKLNGEPKAELLRLSAHAKRCGGINLVCWCAPLPCHGEVIREAIHGIIAKGLV